MKEISIFTKIKLFLFPNKNRLMKETLYINEILGNIICFFILKKKNKKHFREKYMFKKNYVHKKLKIEIEDLYSKLDELTSPKEEYDFIFSIGESCRMGNYLRHKNLSIGLLPFDLCHNFFDTKREEYDKVSGIFGFEGKINLICNRFKDFLNFEDLEIVDGISASVGNKKNGLLYHHDFMGKDMTKDTVKEEFPKVKETYDRRVQRFLMRMDNSKKILICWANCVGTNQMLNIGRQIDTETILKNAEKLQNVYSWGGGGKIINFIFFEHDPKRKLGEMEKIYLSKNVIRIRSNHTIQNEIRVESVFNQIITFEKIFSKIKLNDRLFE